MNRIFGRFGCTQIVIFLGAFLLFQVQPMFAKSILPWFGGTAAVWTTCLVTFQLLLLAGYAYAYALSKAAAGKQVRVHLILVAVSTAIVLLSHVLGQSPMTQNPLWQPLDTMFPFLRVVSLLLVGAGLPYFVLSTTSPLFQFWHGRDGTRKSPYSLYAVSNAGSLLAIISYPTIVEPLLSLHTQFTLWVAGFCLYVLISFLTILSLRRRPLVEEPERCEKLCAEPLAELPAKMATTKHGPPEDRQKGLFPYWRDALRRVRGSFAGDSAAETPDRKEGLSVWQCLSWVAVSASASALLIGTTNQMCQNVAPVPLLWMLPLGLYLLSFILAFRDHAAPSRDGYVVAVLLSAGLVVYVLVRPQLFNIFAQLAIYATALFCCCMLCHKELYRTKPQPAMLTQFYLLTTTGGALGGILSGVFAPLVLSDYVEYQLSLIACCLLALLILAGRRQRWMRAWSIPLSLTALGITAVLLNTIFARQCGVIEKFRNFYGTVRVCSTGPKGGTPVYWLQHGQIMHGLQISSGPLRYKPTSYFGEDSGIGLALRFHQARVAGDPLRIGVIGLGIGTIAAYGKDGDYLRFYEINPQVAEIAKNTRYFNYLADCASTVNIVLGDARVSLERERREGNTPGYDVIVVDAFNSDAIPTHLLTIEALKLYRARLRPGGIIVVQLTNLYLDLVPVVWAAKQQLNLDAVLVKTEDDSRLNCPSFWALLTSDRRFLQDPAVTKCATTRQVREIPVWTDDRTDLLRILKRSMPEQRFPGKLEPKL